MVSSDQIELCFSNLDDVFFIMEFPSLTYRYISPSIQKLRGYAPEDIYADPMILYRHMPHVDRQVIVDYLSPFIGKGPIYFEYPMETKEGEIKWHSSSFSIVEGAEGIHLISGIMRDITQQKKIAVELEKLKAEYEDLYHKAPCGYHSLDAQGNFARINDTELEWFGYEREEIIGKDISKFLLTEESQKKFTANFPLLKRQGFIKDLRLDFKRKNGTILNGFLNASAVVDEKGDLLFTRTVVNDITELTQAEEKLKRSQASLEATNKALKLANQKLERLNLTKDVLLKIISHDLRNPLETIKLISSLLHEKYGELDDEAIMKYLAYINQSGLHATDIIDEMSGVIKLGSEIKIDEKPVLVSEIVEEVLGLNQARAEGKGVRLASRVMKEANSYRVKADTKWLARALDNLVANALKFSHQGGEVCISCQHVGDDVVLAVADKGIGIPKEIRQNLFTKSKLKSREGTAGERGTGLGLSIVQQIVEMHSGQVWAESEEGTGSVFYIKLPSHGLGVC